MSKRREREEEDAIKFINEGGSREKRRELRSRVTYKKSWDLFWLPLLAGRWFLRSEPSTSDFAKDFQRHAILEIHPGLLHKGIFFQDLRSRFAFFVFLIG